MSPAPSPLEDRLRRAVEVVADRHDGDAVLAAVQQRHGRRRRTTRVRWTSAAVAAAAALVAVAVGALVAGAPRSDVVAGPSSTPLTSPPVPGAQRSVGDQVQVPAAGDLSAALAADETSFWLASRSPNAVTRVDLDGTIGPTTPLVGTPILAAADGRSLWVLVDEADGSDQPYRLKLVDRADGQLLSSSRVRLDGGPVALTRVDGRTVITTEHTEVILDDAAAAIDRPRTDPATRVTSGDAAWSYEAGLLSSTDASGRVASSPAPGVRRLVPAPAAAWGAVALERVVDGRVVVELRTAADAPATRVAEIDPSASVAAVTPDAVWVLDLGALRRLAR